MVFITVFMAENRTAEWMMFAVLPTSESYEQSSCANNVILVFWCVTSMNARNYGITQLFPKWVLAIENSDGTNTCYGVKGHWLTFCPPSFC